jgi:hypothetical protein
MTPAQIEDIEQNTSRRVVEINDILSKAAPEINAAKSVRQSAVSCGYRMRGLAGRVSQRWVYQALRMRLRTVMIAVAS